MQRKTVAICLITNNDYLQTRFVIENLMSKTALRYRLQIVDNGSSDEELKEYLRWLVKETKGYLKEFPEPLPIAECYNYLLDTVYQDVCVFFPCNCIVNKNWLEDILTSLNSVVKSGIVGIRPVGSKIKFIPLLHHSYTKKDDYMENVIASPERINTVVAFKKDRVDQAGIFDKKLDADGFELSEFCFRVKANGFNNFYIRKQACYKLNIKNEILYPTPTQDKFQKFKNAVETMFKVRSFTKK